MEDHIPEVLIILQYGGSGRGVVDTVDALLAGLLLYRRTMGTS